jgi:hypothetical protein
MRDDSSEEGVHHITAAFDALVSNFDRLLRLHADDANVVVHLARVKALARRGSQLSRELPH